jgi:hypothetical protein
LGSPRSIKPGRHTSALLPCAVRRLVDISGAVSGKGEMKIFSPGRSTLRTGRVLGLTPSSLWSTKSCGWAGVIVMYDGISGGRSERSQSVAALRILLRDLPLQGIPFRPPGLTATRRRSTHAQVAFPPEHPAPPDAGQPGGAIARDVYEPHGFRTVEASCEHCIILLYSVLQVIAVVLRMRALANPMRDPTLTAVSRTSLCSAAAALRTRLRTATILIPAVMTDPP